MERLKNDMIKNGGITLNEKGESVALNKGFVVSLDGYEFTSKDVTTAFNKLVEYKGAIKGRNNLYCGAWLDSGVWYIDINIIVNKRRDAERIGKKNKQKAYFNLSTCESVTLDYTIPYYYITKIIRNSNGEEIDERTLATFDSLEDLERYTGTSKGRLTHYINNIVDDSDTAHNSDLIEFNELRIYKDLINIMDL